MNLKVANTMRPKNRVRQRGSSDLTVGLLLTAAGAAMVGMTVPTMFKSSDTASRTFERQVDILERGAGGGGGGGGGSATGPSGFDVGGTTSRIPSPAAGGNLHGGAASNLTNGAAGLTNGNAGLSNGPAAGLTNAASGLSNGQPSGLSNAAPAGPLATPTVAKR